MNKLLFLMMVTISSSCLACSMTGTSQPFYIKGQLIDWETSQKASISIPDFLMLKIESIEFKNGWGQPGVGCPAILFIVLSLPEISSYTFTDVGVFFQINGIEASIMKIANIPYSPKQTNGAKTASFAIIAGGHVSEKYLSTALTLKAITVTSNSKIESITAKKFTLK